VRVSILNYRKDKTPFWNILTVVPLADSNFNVTQYVGILIRPKISPVGSILPSLAWNSSKPELLLPHEQEQEKQSDDTPVPRQVGFAAETLLPTLKGHYRLRAYKELSDDQREIICIIHGQVEGLENVPLRVHDQCFTSEVLGSMKCDCRQQLDFALEFIRSGSPQNEQKQTAATEYSLSTQEGAQPPMSSSFSTEPVSLTLSNTISSPALAPQETIPKCQVCVKDHSAFARCLHPACELGMFWLILT
jgi:hypothetical protein